ncbi:uncharacterized protein LOC134625873 isoform X3 [Pelmatolapia mariae]|uniref:uncharacterized protein LOC134625873 isoform X3 n=1 Tax=Pelmatolapia mariae TaxID=158779 RepID=UPI002FE68D56
MTTCNTTKAESESKGARMDQHLSKFAKITEGIMTSHGCYLCLLLLSVILIEPSEAGCMNHFKKADWKKTTIDKLPENIPVKIMNKSEDIVVCSLMKDEDCIDKTEETCFLRECFGDYKPPCNETDKNISVPFYHFMCLTDIAKGLRDKTNETNGGSLKPTAEEVCKVYEKVCKRDSPNPAAKTTTPTACTTTTPSTEATTNKTTSTPSATTTPTTEATTNKTTATPCATTTPTTEATTNKTTSTPSATTTPTTEATTNKTTATPSATTTPTTEATTNKTTATPSATTTPTTEATTNKTTATPSATTTPTTTEATTNKTTATPSATTTTPTTEATTNKTTSTPCATTTPTTEATTKKPQVSTTAVSTITTPSSPLNLQQKDGAEKKESNLQIIIGVLIFTNFLWAVAFYMYTQRLQRSNEIPNLKEEEAMTVRNTFRSDIGEGSILLMTPESSIIINSPETTIIESLCPQGTHL